MPEIVSPLLEKATPDNPDPGTFSIAAGIWWTLSGIIGSFAGGVVAGRLCGAAKANTARWHGFVAWCVTTLIVCLRGRSRHRSNLHRMSRMRR